MSTGPARSSRKRSPHPSVPDASRLGEALDRRLATAQSGKRLPSVVGAVFRDGNVVWERAIGLADPERGEEATVAHRYRIGSITKTFTTVTVLQLRDAGRLALDQSLASLVPDFPPGPTVRQALSHLTGIQREPPGEVWETMRSPSRDELIAGLADAETVLAPGQEWHYSNLAFAVLGEIVARETGSFATTLRERVLGPLGLDNTRLEPDGRRATPLFVHPWTGVARTEPELELAESTSAVGMLWSTVGDLARFGAFLCDGRDGVLRKESLDEMARVHAMVDEERWTVGWGLGLGLYRRGDRVLVGHGGAMPGFLAAIAVDRGSRTGSCVLANAGAGFDPQELALDLAELALDALPLSVHPWQPGSAPPPDVVGILGPWWTEGDQVVLTWDAGTLRMELVGGPPGRSVSWLDPDGEGRWRIATGRERGEVVRAVRDAAGAVSKLYVATYPATRAPSTFGEA